jgi:predicted GH43/DUF377 family glycosyl hydrolase
MAKGAHSRADAARSKGSPMLDNTPLAQTLPLMLRPDPTRTVIRPFWPAGQDPKGMKRLRATVERILAFDEAELEHQLDRTWRSLEERHKGTRGVLLRRAEELHAMVGGITDLPEERRLLLGAYFSAEYAFEAAALFNPSIVRHPEQGQPGGATRFILSLRGIGEGHLSSVTFRTGTWHGDDTLTIDEPGPTGVPPVVGPVQGWHDAQTIQLNCSGSRDPSETVLFPVLASQERGIEDLRLTVLEREGRPATYVGTYTAVDGQGASQELLQTDDFIAFKMHPVGGDLAHSKGMALFPRKLGDRYLAIGRQDNENLWLATSQDLFTWDGGTMLAGPAYPWESIQMGNCGSPIEIEEGWLLLTHGVGVMRNYCIGAMLLDRDDPARIIGRMAEPLIEPGDDDRDGYVPNVAYSCGGLVRGRKLLLPYGVADEFTRFAIVSLDRLVAALS